MTDTSDVYDFRDRIGIPFTAPADQLQKRDAGKLDPMMIEEDLALALENINAVLAYGVAKYGKRGGWKAVAIERYRSANGRHRREVMKHGLLDCDAETGLLHLAHETVNNLFVLQQTLAQLSERKRQALLQYKEPPKVG